MGDVICAGHIVAFAKESALQENNESLMDMHDWKTSIGIDTSTQMEIPNYW